MTALLEYFNNDYSIRVYRFVTIQNKCCCSMLWVIFSKKRPLHNLFDWGYSPTCAPHLPFLFSTDCPCWDLLAIMRLSDYKVIKYTLAMFGTYTQHGRSRSLLYLVVSLWGHEVHLSCVWDLIDMVIIMRWSHYEVMKYILAVFGTWSL